MKKLTLFLLAAILWVAFNGHASERIFSYANEAEPETLDPAMAYGTIENRILMSLFEGLTQYDPKTLTPISALAESWGVSEDGKIYTFKIRNTAKWSDGTPLNANDFVYSWERLLNPATGAKYAMQLFSIKNAQKYNSGELTDPTQLGFKAIDLETFEVTLNNPVPYFTYLTAHMVTYAVPKHAIETHKEKWTHAGNMVTSGPFHLTAWAPHKEIIAMKSNTYWDAANVKLAGVRYTPIEDQGTNVKRYKSSEADFVNKLPPLQLTQLKNEEAGFLSSAHLGTYLVVTNTTQPPLNDPRVRQAFAMAIDRDALTTQYLNGFEISHSSLVPDGLEGYLPAKGPSFDPIKASTLLDEAGYKDRTTFPKISYRYNTDDRHKLVAQVLQQMWKTHLGIDVELLNEEWKTYVADLKSTNFDLIRMGWVADYPDPNGFTEIFTTQSEINFSKWSNADFDALQAKAAAEPNPLKRFQLIREAESIFLTDLPTIPLFTEGIQSLLKPNVKGFFPNLIDLHPLKFVSFDETTVDPIPSGPAKTLWQKLTAKK